jgi:hypothetical protein
MNAILAAFFLQGGLAVMQAPPNPDQYQHQYWQFDITRVQNPYGIVAVGFEHDWGQWNVSIQGRHMSTTTTGLDHGQNTVELSVRVHPFR